MNLYVRTINDVIDHIEQNIAAPLTLQSISKQFYLSEYHFSRLFKIFTGINLKHYILCRKLAVALDELKNSNTPVIDIAYNLGFEYPEVFSRAFKKQFGISPTAYRDGNFHVNVVPKAFVVERDIRNFGGVLTLKESYVYLDTFDLDGIFLEVDENDIDFEKTLKSAGESFLAKINRTNVSGDQDFYSVVNCHGDESGKYTVFFGEKFSKESGNTHQDTRNIPAGWYACHAYYGEMIDIRTTFVEDFYRWMVVKEIEPCPNGIGMINIYNRENPQDIRILIPVKEPK